MIGATPTGSLDPAQRARVIYAQARSEVTDRLWRAALGHDGGDDRAASVDSKLPMSLESLLSLLDDRRAAQAPTPQASVVTPRSDSEPDVQARPLNDDSFERDGGQESPLREGSIGGYGPNAAYAPALDAAARRTGLPAGAIATIVHAEAAKDRGGRWLPYSRNPRSSAAGLGQFLSGTWRSEAERAGTWLNQVARQNGWLDDSGRTTGSGRAALLALRYDPEAAIQATADYAKSNLDSLRRAGVRVGEGAQDIAKAAYLGHHLGLGDAIRFLKNGLEPHRAQMLLKAQVGAAAAERRIVASGNAASAHREWLLEYVGKNIRPDRFGA